VGSPSLRHLYLDGWPLGNAGAKALAANPALSGLTRLSVCQCGLTDAGLHAIVRSPYLQGLLQLNATGNELRRASVLLDRNLLPDLRCATVGNLPPAAAERFRKIRDCVEVFSA
jgi:hypothetical protein